MILFTKLNLPSGTSHLSYHLQYIWFASHYLLLTMTDSNNRFQTGDVNSTVHSVHNSCIAISTVAIFNNGVHSQNASRATSSPVCILHFLPSALFDWIHNHPSTFCVLKPNKMSSLLSIPPEFYSHTSRE
jgi:hypothetical protein